MTAMINYGGHFRRPTLASFFRQRRPVLVGQVRLGEAALTPEEAFTYKVAIDDGLNKTNEIELFVQQQGANLTTKLGSQVVSWSQNWAVAQAKAPEIANFKVMLDGNGPYLWDATKDSTFQQWKTAVDNLYNIYKSVTEPGVPPPPPPPGGQPPPVIPPVTTPASQTSNTILYVVGGLGAAALVGSLIYVFTRK